jgi:hypothetical protein
MKIDKKIISLLIVGLLASTVMSGCIEQQGGSSGIGLITIPVASASASDNPKYAMASYYSSEELIINTSVSQYDLPLDLTSITNINDIYSRFYLNEEQKNLLSGNGFVVIDHGFENDIIQPYKEMKLADIPIFVTSDTLLHLYHIQFDEILKGIEEREFFGKILDISKALFDKSIEGYQNYIDSDLKEAARRNIVYLAVGLSLLQTPTEEYDESEDIQTVDFSIPSYVNDEVEGEVAFIESQDGFHDSPIFLYREDYSQYKPRGHYTQSEKLKRYFKAMMWYGRMSFLMKGGNPHCQYCDFLISENDAKIQTIQASLIATALPIVTIDDESLENIWTRIYKVTSFFVGTADDLTPYEYLDCIKDVFGSEFNATELANDTKLLELKVELVQLRNPKIYGGTGEIVILKPPGVPFTIEDLNETLDKTKGMRLMGQRFIPDSYMFQQLVFPAVDPFTGTGKPFTMEHTDGGPARVFPRGLDVMAVLGSNRALEILENEGDTEYEHYYEQLSMLQENFSSLNITEWNRNLYFSWIYTLKSLLKEYNSSYPTFMNTIAWQGKELQTALASWSELRHDTILYGKQSYTPIKATSVEPPEKPVVGYVEPVPEFYLRIHALTKMTRDGLTDLNVLNNTETNRLQSLEIILERLINISKKELENKELTDSDYEFIRNFGENLDSIVTGVKDKGKETTIIADVHTDTNTEQVLEEGVGYVDIILVAYMTPNDNIIVGAGPVLSYYEFKHPMDDRLTDEQWNDMLQGGQTQDKPDWTISFISE